MSYYWFNRSKMLKDVWDKYHNKGGRTVLLSIKLVTKKF